MGKIRLVIVTLFLVVQQKASTFMALLRIVVCFLVHFAEKCVVGVRSIEKSDMKLFVKKGHKNQN